jgi:hypothetical protein
MTATRKKAPKAPPVVTPDRKVITSTITIVVRHPGDQGYDKDDLRDYWDSKLEKLFKGGYDDPDRHYGEDRSMTPEYVSQTVQVEAFDNFNQSCKHTKVTPAGGHTCLGCGATIR